MAKEYWNCIQDLEIVKNKMIDYYGSQVTFYNIGWLTFSFSWLPDCVIRIEDTIYKGTGISGSTVVNQVSTGATFYGGEFTITMGAKTFFMTRGGGDCILIDELTNSKMFVGTLTTATYRYASSWINNVIHCTVVPAHLNGVRYGGKYVVSPFFIGLDNPNSVQELYVDANDNPITFKNIKAHSGVGTTPPIISGSDLFFGGYSVSRGALMNCYIAPYISLL